MVFVFGAKLNVCVRYVSPSGPKCFKSFMLMLSGPVELLYLLNLIASCLVVTCVGVGCSRWIHLSMSVSVVFCVVLC